MQLQIRRAVAADVEAVDRIMRTVERETQRSGQFVADSREFIARHIAGEGFTLLYCAQEEPVGFLIVRFPGTAEDNLGRDAGLAPKELAWVAHMESAAVLPAFRGHHVQRQLVQAAESCLQGQKLRWAAATVHPENAASMRSMTALGYRVILTAEKYGGQLRSILMKNLEQPG